MKNKDMRNTVLKICMAVFTLFVLFAGMTTLYSVLPGAVCYSVSAETKSENAMKEVRLAMSEISARYKSIADIPFGDGFVIKSEKDSIYVFRKDEALYKINSALSDFPESDKLVIREGFEVENKQKLQEIVEYLES